jgi:hypothetical protein
MLLASAVLRALHGGAIRHLSGRRCATGPHTELVAETKWHWHVSALREPLKVAKAASERWGLVGGGRGGDLLTEARI